MAQVRKYGSAFLSFGTVSAGWAVFKTFSWAGGSVANLQDGSDSTVVFSPVGATGYAELLLPDSAIPDNSSVTLAEWDVKVSHLFGPSPTTASFPSIDASPASSGWSTDAGIFTEVTKSSALAQTGTAAKAAGWGFGHNASGSEADVSEFCLRLTFTLPAPTAATSPATNTTSTTATLNGTINPNTATSQYPVSYKFQWGTTAAYGNETTTIPGQTGSANITISADISGLSPATTYHFRVVSFNADQTTNGADMTFVASGFGSELAVAF